MPDAGFLKRKVRSVVKQELAIKPAKAPTGWRNFGLGLSGGGS